jgi:hypothetical protein
VSTDVAKAASSGGIGIGGEAKISTPPPTPEHAKTEYSTNLVLEDEVTL